MLADPDMPRKVLEGRPEDVRKCLTCNECLQTGVFDTWACNCTVNYGLGRGEQTNIKEPSEAVPKKVLVIGGGPGGIRGIPSGSPAGTQGNTYGETGKAGRRGKNCGSVLRQRGPAWLHQLAGKGV